LAQPLSPLWWLEKLVFELEARRPTLKLMDDYYRGKHPYPFLTRTHDAKMRNEFAKMLENSVSNFMRLVVDVTEERLRVEGFRLSASSDEASDKESWRIWQANQLDADSQTAFVEALVKGVSYLSVWAGDEFPTIAIEDPMQTIVGYEPGSNFRRRAAALKVWRDDWTGNDRANVYLPNGIYKFERAGTEGDETDTMARVSGSEGAFGGPQFPVTRVSAESQPSSWRELEGEFVANGLGVVPIIPLRNRPRLLVEGESELADVYRIQTQINGFLFLLNLAGYTAAHKQRWAVGLSLMEDSRGQPREPFDTAVDKLWVAENPEVKFGEFSATDLGGYIDAIEQKVLHIAVTTRTPRHYLIQQGQSPSGDAIKRFNEESRAETAPIRRRTRGSTPFGAPFRGRTRRTGRFRDYLGRSGDTHRG
jgi:hypothetical protein